MKIFKRVIDLVCSAADIKDITTMKIDPGVEVELTIRSEEEEY
jgi:ribosomal protein S10